MNQSICIGFDYDGTLCEAMNPIPKKLVDQICDLQKEGYELFLASGKSLSFLIDISQKMGIEPFLIAAENGGHIYLPASGEEKVFGNTEDLNQFREVVDSFKLPIWEYEEKISIWSRRFGPVKVHEAGLIIKSEIQNYKFNNLNTYIHPDGGVDVVPPGIDKGNVRFFLPKKVDAKIYYIGDSYNDLPAMNLPNVTPCCVDNAVQDVKDLVSERKGLISRYKYGEGSSDIIRNIVSRHRS